MFSRNKQRGIWNTDIETKQWIRATKLCIMQLNQYHINIKYISTKYSKQNNDKNSHKLWD